MKMSVKLTADELANVVDSVVDTAIDNGFDCIVEDDEEFNAIFAIVDAALEAMGISIEEDEDEDEEFYNEDEDEEEEDDPTVRFPGIAEMVYEKDGRGAISEEDAHEVLDSMKAMIAESCPELNPIEKFELLTKMWLQFGEDFGIEVVDMGE